LTHTVEWLKKLNHRVFDDADDVADADDDDDDDDAVNAGPSKGTPGDAKCVTEILGGE